MKAKIKVEKEVEPKTIIVKAGVRYWEDTTVNGVEDEEGELIPFRDGDYWCPLIDIEKGQIVDWPNGTTASIHYKICDDGEYYILDAKGKTILSIEGYVPDTMSPEDKGFGDYIIMEVDENGFINNWDFDINDFTEED